MRQWWELALKISTWSNLCERIRNMEQNDCLKCFLIKTGVLADWKRWSQKLTTSQVLCGQCEVDHYPIHQTTVPVLLIFWSVLSVHQECGPMPNVMAALLSVQRRKVWLTPTTRVPCTACSNAAKTRNPLKFAGVPQTGKSISASSGPKFTILWGHVKQVLLFNNFFPNVNTYLGCEDIARHKVVRWCPDGDFLCLVFSASCVQHVSDLHPKFALRPHHV